MQPSEILKIAVVGPESTGKSTMSEYLAEHYHTVWVPEFARGYCEKLTEPPTWQDEINMFYGQIALEKEYLPKANKILICDTTFITVKIWSDYTFGRSPQEVLDELPKHPYDLYLLLNIDLPWEEDPLRDFPHMREHFMDVWYKELNALNANYSLISGAGQERYDTAVAAIDEFLGGQRSRPEVRYLISVIRLLTSKINLNLTVDATFKNTLRHIVESCKIWNPYLSISIMTWWLSASRAVKKPALSSTVYIRKRCLMSPSG